MPEIQRLAASLPAGTAVLTVNLTAREASPSAPLAYLTEHGYSFPVLLDPADEAGARVPGGLHAHQPVHQPRGRGDRPRGRGR